MINSVEKQKLVNSVRFERYRYIIENLIKKNKLTNEDIIGLLNVDINYGLYFDKNTSSKDRILKTIYNAPFILCDINLFDKNMKQVIYSLLKYRYEQEINELNYDLEHVYINEDEYNDRLEMINFNYFYSSKEGATFFEKEIQKQKQL